ncbi:hypothetical protein BD780_003158 [Clostridium tetanomorphum]|nr:VCBS repeat-containing protein [Clostridium tetanomorphum]NRS85933.1 hypothetical protein [Clostridium tetanomorphum]
MFLFIFIISFTLYLYSQSSENTFSKISYNTLKRIDLNGDKKNDILYIKVHNDNYYIQASVNNHNFSLQPEKSVKSLGKAQSNPIQIYFNDLNNDNKLEIFTQSFYGKEPIQHVFLFTDSGFKDIFCSSNNVLGFINLNKTLPKFITGKFENEFYFKSYVLLENKLNELSYYPKEDFIGKKAITEFIKIMESISSIKKNNFRKLCHENISGKSIENINKILDEFDMYIYNNSNFMAKNISKDNIETTWVIDFKGISFNNNVSNNCSIELKLRKSKDNLNKFKIYSIKEI